MYRGDSSVLLETFASTFNISIVFLSFVTVDDTSFLNE